MAAPIIAQYGYRLLDLNGVPATEGHVEKGLVDIIEAFNTKHKPEQPADYFKAYRSIRKAGTYCVPVVCQLVGGEADRFGYILVIWHVDYETEDVRRAIRSRRHATPVEPTPLEVLIAQEQVQEPGFANVQTLETALQPVGELNKFEAELYKYRPKKVQHRPEKQAKKAQKNGTPGLRFYTVTYHKRNQITGATYKQPHTIRVHAASPQQAVEVANEDFQKLGSKYLPVVIGADDGTLA